MNKEELVELSANSQDAILERVDSKLQELKSCSWIMKEKQDTLAETDNPSFSASLKESSLWKDSEMLKPAHGVNNLLTEVIVTYLFRQVKLQN